MNKIILGSFILLLTSCHHVYYAPGTPNITQFTEKDEVRINGGIVSGFDSEFKGGDLQFAYAPANKLGVMLNGFTVSETENTTDTRVESGKGTYGELGVGYWTAFDKKKEFTFEVYGGFGGGVVNSDYGQGENSKVSIGKLFLQPAVGYKMDNFEVALTARFAHVNWKVKQLRTTQSEVQSDMEYIRQRPNFFAFEPGLIIRGGSKNVKAQVGLTVSANNRYSGFHNVYAPKESVVGYIGFSVNLSGKKKVQIN